MPLSEHARYINPYTDFGFKLLFGTEVNKDILIDFLNELLHLESPIKDITYQNTDQLGDSQEERKAVFDVYCVSEKGEHFIVEMQKAIQLYFVDRSIYYSTFPIREQAQKGNWDFNLSAVYTVGILDFIFDKDDPEYFHHEVKLMDVNTNKVLTDKLNFIYLEMPKFKKTIDECETLLDKIMFVLKNLTNLLDRPAQLQERIFTKIFETAEIAGFTRDERSAYEESLKVYRDNKNTLDTAAILGYKEGRERGLAEGRAEGRERGLAEGRAEGRERGLAEGRAEGRAEGVKEGMLRVAANMKRLGLPIETIVQTTGVSLEDIENLA